MQAELVLFFDFDSADSRPDAPPSADASWQRFSRWLVGATVLICVALYGFVIALDPYGLRAGPGRAPTPIMDVNQRFLYPQLARSGRFDAAVFGTSTIRLLDPDWLDRAFGARFANLGLNAGTPWEQVQLASLFLRRVPSPSVLIFGIDMTWCEADADRVRLTSRAFPLWLYDDDPWNDFAPLVNLTSVEIAGRVALQRLGLMQPRMRSDGYEVFTPPEASYDLARAREHFRTWPRPPDEAVRATDIASEAQPMPALDWLADLAGRVPPGTRTVFAFMPNHVSMLPAPGTVRATGEALCKQRVADIARRHGATAVDFRLASTISTEDSNYWDPLHYRLPIAARIIDGLSAALATGQSAADGSYRVIASPRS